MAYAPKVVEKKRHKITIKGKRLELEYERADKPGRYVRKTATELWTVLAPSPEIEIPGFGGGNTWEVIGSGYTKLDAINAASVTLLRRQRKGDPGT